MMHNDSLHAAAGSAQSHPCSPLPSPDAVFSFAPAPSQLPHHRSYSVPDIDLPYRYNQHYPLPRQVSPMPTVADADDAVVRVPGVSPRRPDHYRARSRSLLSVGASHSLPAADSEGESSDDKEQRTLPTGLVVDEGHLAGAEESTVIKRRSRTLTTPNQQRRLQQVLEQTRFPSTELREQLARELGMTPRRVQIWFQNRRQGMKKAREQRAEQDSSLTSISAATTAALPYPSYHSYPTTPNVGYSPSTQDPSAQDPASFGYYTTSTAGPVNLELFAQHTFSNQPATEPPLNRPLSRQLPITSLPSNHHPALDSYAPYHPPRHQHRPSTTSLSTLSESDASLNNSVHGWSCASSVTSVSQPESAWMGCASGSRLCPTSTVTLGPLTSPSPYPSQPATWMTAQSQSSMSPVMSRLPAGRSRSMTNPEQVMTKHRMSSMPNGTIMEENGHAPNSTFPIGMYSTGALMAPHEQTSQSIRGIVMGRSRSSTDAVLSEGLLQFRFDRTDSRRSTPPVPPLPQPATTSQGIIQPTAMTRSPTAFISGQVKNESLGGFQR